jgi:septal ring-binding cell division protein DamX
MKPAYSIVPAIASTIEQANGQRVAVAGGATSLAPARRALVERQRVADASIATHPRAPTTHAPGPASAARPAFAAPRCRRPD